MMQSTCSQLFVAKKNYRNQSLGLDFTAIRDKKNFIWIGSTEIDSMLIQGFDFDNSFSINILKLVLCIIWMKFLRQIELL